MDSRPLRTDEDHQAALREISVLMESDPELGTPEGDRLHELVTRVQAYESRKMPILIQQAGARGQIRPFSECFRRFPIVEWSQTAI